MSGGKPSFFQISPPNLTQLNMLPQWNMLRIPRGKRISRVKKVGVIAYILRDTVKNLPRALARGLAGKPTNGGG